MLYTEIKSVQTLNWQKTDHMIKYSFASSSCCLKLYWLSVYSRQGSLVSREASFKEKVRSKWAVLYAKLELASTFWLFTIHWSQFS